jgi:hypothetical protein
MSMDRNSTIVNLSQSIYLGLLIFYPRELRRKFGAEMAEVFVTSLRDAIADRGRAGMIFPWRSALCELLTVALPMRLASNAAMAGAISLLASSVLVLLFFRAVT